MHRVNWDLRYPDPPTLNYGYYGTLLDYREYTLNWHATPGHTYRSTIVGIMVPPGTYSATLTVDGRSESRPVVIVPDPRVPVSAAALAAQFRLERRMVAGLTASYEAFNYIQALRESGVAPSVDAELAALATNEFGIVHRDLGRRYSDQFIADAAPDASVVEGVDGPCRQLDAALERLRAVQRSVSANAGSSGGRWPSWTPPPAPACGR
jgi:hypothetical protein